MRSRLEALQGYDCSVFFFSSRRRHTRLQGDWSSDVCSSDLDSTDLVTSGIEHRALIGPTQVAVLDPAGNEIRRISSPLFDSPWGLAFIGESLLVTNADIQKPESPSKWTVLKVFVGETGLPLNRPKTSHD